MNRPSWAIRHWSWSWHRDPVATDVAGEPTVDGAAAAEGAPPRPQELPTDAPRGRGGAPSTPPALAEARDPVEAADHAAGDEHHLVRRRRRRRLPVGARRAAGEGVRAVDLRPQLAGARHHREYDRLVSNLLRVHEGTDGDPGGRGPRRGASTSWRTPTLTAEQESDLERVLQRRLRAQPRPNLGTTSLPDVFIPTSPAQRYLQAWYTAPYDDFDDALAVTDAGDGSTWSEAHAQFHRFFQELVNRYGYEDVLLIDDEGNVVYSAYKGVDLGTNVLDGPYDGSNLRDRLRAGDRVELRRLRRDHRPRALPAVVRRPDRVGGVTDRRRGRDLRGARPAALDRQHQRRHDGQPGLGGRRPRRDRRDVPRRSRRADALDVTPGGRGPGGLRGARRSTAAPRPRSPPGPPGSAAPS